MTRLPIDESLDSIVESLRNRRCLVLLAPPGAGKTTRVPVALLNSGLLGRDHPNLVMLQPRRVAARAAASRIAEENGWSVGGRVGYQIRQEKRVGPDTRIKVVTEGILNRQLVDDPFLEGVGAVLLDEFHERSQHSDLAIALLREVRESVRDDLIVVVMSATMDAGPVAKFLGDAPIIRVDGRSFPVTIQYQGWQANDLTTSMARTIEAAVLNDPTSGDLLGFLPGVGEIHRTARELAGWASRESAIVLPLHGSLSSEEQDAALRPNSRRKVILATNIAETSLTIEGVTTVVDSGLARFARYDPEKGLDKLELGPISRASADQRAGRAGRTAPGRCIRLWSEGFHRGLDEFDTPEIQRVDLTSIVLALHAWGHADPLQFGWFEAPEAASIDAAERLLVDLGAIEAPGGSITTIGRRLLDLPVHPRLGRLLIAASDLGFLHEGAALAAILSSKFSIGSRDERNHRPEVHASSDVLIQLDRLEEAERSNFSAMLAPQGINLEDARQVSRERQELLRIARRLNGTNPREPTEDDLLQLILLAYPDRVVRRRGVDGATGVMVGGRGVRLAKESVVRDAEFFVALDPWEDRRGGTLEARVRTASAIRLEWLEEFFPNALQRVRSVDYDEDRDRVVGVATLRYRDLTLREDRNAPVDSKQAGEALARVLSKQGRAFFEQNEATANWLVRLDLARQALTEFDWPSIDETDWTEFIELACLGKKSPNEISGSSLQAILKSRLTYAENQRLDDLVPEALTVPSGNRIKLTYAKGSPPVLAVRLQELFGWPETPRIASGRLPVLLHLLGPNYRPVQITDDLASFWANTYFQVRKDLRARYPKHSWPDDPLQARAESRGGRKRD
jgi:ATP-dependent helicase HrpB